MTKYDFIKPHEILGRIGELITSHIFNYTLSEEKYDMTGDMEDKKTKQLTELKTQVLNPDREGYVLSIPASQENKCMKVHSLKHLIYNDSDILDLYETFDRTKFKRYVTSKGTKMIGFHRSAAKIIYQIISPELTQLMRYYSTSGFVKKKFFPGYTYHDLGDDGVKDLIKKAKIIKL
jgi:hypothetical protein